MSVLASPSLYTARRPTSPGISKLNLRPIEDHKPLQARLS